MKIKDSRTRTRWLQHWFKAELRCAGKFEDLCRYPISRHPKAGDVIGDSKDPSAIILHVDVGGVYDLALVADVDTGHLAWPTNVRSSYLWEK